MAEAEGADAPGDNEADVAVFEICSRDRLRSTARTKARRGVSGMFEEDRLGGVFEAFEVFVELKDAAVV